MKNKALIIIIAITFSLICTPSAFSQPEVITEDTPISDAITDLNENQLENLLAEDTTEVEQVSKLEKVSSSDELELTKLTDYMPTKQIQSFDTEEYWLLNFTFVEIYSWYFHQENSGSIFEYNLNETFTITMFAFFPVILAIYKNDTSTTDQHMNVITKAIVDPNFKGKAGFIFEFDFEFLLQANLWGFNPKVGPGDIPLSYEKIWEYDTPLDGELALAQIDFLFSVIPQFPPLKLGCTIEPKLDSDFSASLRANDTELELSQDKLNWFKSDSIQSFSVYIPEFFTEDTAVIDLFDFNMEVSLNLAFFLTIKLDLPILRSYPLRIKLFSIPIASINLECENIETINIETDIVPTDKLPFVYGVDYSYSDQLGDNDGIIEPGETIDFALSIVNLGEGSALSLNTSVYSDNVTVTGTDSVDLLLRNRGNIEIQTGFQFVVPVSYTGDYVEVRANFEYYSVNGTYIVDYFDMYFRIVDSSDTYLEVSEIYYDHPEDKWYSGDDIDISFLLTNRGARDIYYADIYLFAGYDTDVINTATLTSSITNASTSVLSIGESVVLGNISISSTVDHDDALIFLFLDVYYEDDTFSYIDILDRAIPIFVPKPEFSILSAVGYETDADGLFEAGETIYAVFEIENIGQGNGYSIEGFLSSDNPDLNFTDPDVWFYDLAPSESDTSSYAIFNVPLTARNQTANFTLYLTAEDSKGHIITQQFLIVLEIVEAPSPEISLLYYGIDDSIYGDDDGYAEPGEIFFIYVYIQVDNVGFTITGSLFTDANLIIYNSSSYYGNLADESFSGDGFILEVPLNYDGTNAIIEVEITAESYSGRKVTSYGWIDLSVGKGDLTAPTMTLLDEVPSTIIQNDTFSFSYDVVDPNIVGETKSGIDTLILFWSWNGGEVMQSEYVATDLEGEWIVTIDISLIGTYEILLVAVDAAGNAEYLGEGAGPFIIHIVSAVPELGNFFYASLLISGIIITSVIFTRRRLMKKS